MCISHRKYAQDCMAIVLIVVKNHANLMLYSTVFSRTRLYRYENNTKEINAKALNVNAINDMTVKGMTMCYDKEKNIGCFYILYIIQ